MIQILLRSVRHKEPSGTGPLLLISHDLAGSTQKRLHTRSEESIHWAFRASFFWYFLHSMSRGSADKGGHERSELQNLWFELDPVWVFKNSAWRKWLTWALCAPILRNRIVTQTIWTCYSALASWRARRPIWPLRPAAIYRFVKGQMWIRLRQRNTLFMIARFSSSACSSICPRLVSRCTKLRSISRSCFAPEFWATWSTLAAHTVVAKD